MEGLAHTVSHGIVKGIDTLAAEHIVLIGLNGNGGQRRIGADGVRLTQETVTRGKTAPKELQQVNLAAVEGNQGKVLIMNVNPVFLVGFPEFIGEDIVIHKVLSPFGAQLQHDAHGSIGVDIGIVALGIHVHRIGKENITIGRHEVLLRRTTLSMFLTIGDVFLGDIVEVVLHEFLLYDILYFFNTDVFPVLDIPLHLTGDFVDILRGHFLFAVIAGASYGVVNFLAVIRHCMAGALRHCF